MREKTCFFTGHRQISSTDQYKAASGTRAAIKEMIKNGVTRFISGGAVGYDQMAADIVLSLKKEEPGIELLVYLPCRDYAAFWNERDLERIRHIIKNADEIRYITEESLKDSMRLRNQAMVIDAAYGIAWFKNRPGGTMQTLAMAKKMDCRVINTAKEIW